MGFERVLGIRDSGMQLGIKLNYGGDLSKLLTLLLPLCGSFLNEKSCLLIRVRGS